MQRSAVGQVVADVSKEPSAFIFTVKQISFFFDCMIVNMAVQGNFAT